jgi:hypothetical protein
MKRRSQRSSASCSRVAGWCSLPAASSTTDGVDDGTWEHHRRHGDYSRWIAQSIKDEQLTRAVQRVEAMRDVAPAEGRALMRKAIEERYTLPA